MEPSRVDADEVNRAVAAGNATVPLLQLDLSMDSLNNRRAGHSWTRSRVDDQISLMLAPRKIRLTGKGGLLPDREPDPHAAKGISEDENLHPDPLFE